MSTPHILRTIRNNKRFLVSTHINPDPDALCSALAVGIFLRSLGKSVKIVNHEAVPPRFDFLPGVKSIKPYREGMRVDYDVAIVVDCGDLGRIGKVRTLLREGRPLINIDHHITNDSFGDLNLVEPDASSTAEVLYGLLKKAKCPFTRNLAMHLYIGIMTDTGSFRYENTTAKTHRIVAELLEFKISASGVYRELYEIISHNDLVEFTKIIKGFDMFFGKQVVCVQLRKTVISKFSGEFDLRDAIFKFLRSIKGVEVFVIFTEVERDRTRVNLRSASRFDVARLANSFKGGGHKRASGYIVNKSIPEAQREVLRKIKRVL